MHPTTHLTSHPRRIIPDWEQALQRIWVVYKFSAFPVEMMLQVMGMIQLQNFTGDRRQRHVQDVKTWPPLGGHRLCSPLCLFTSKAARLPACSESPTTTHRFLPSARQQLLFSKSPSVLSCSQVPQDSRTLLLCARAPPWRTLFQGLGKLLATIHSKQDQIFEMHTGT